MTWLVFGVSCLLVLAGAVSIISGAPIIQLERGWAEVISGTVAVSSGGVVFALAGILMRLEAIRDTMAARTLPVPAESVPVPLAAARDPSPTQKPLDEPLALPLAPPQVDAAPPPAPTSEDDGKIQGLWKRVKRPDPADAAAERTDAEALSQQGFPDRVVPDEPPFAPLKVDAPVVVPAHPVPGDAPIPSVSTVQSAPADRDSGQIGWLERSLFKGGLARSGGEIVPARSEPAMAVPEAALPESHDTRVGASPARADAPASHVTQTSALDAAAAAEPAPTPDLVSDLHDDVDVVGRYKAGSASYVMYSDGTIEVETESGETHRFGSMDELKSFIAQQDTTVPG